MEMQFPTYTPTNNVIRYKRLQLTDFEFVETGGRWDMIIGGMVNQFEGSAGEYSQTGGGMKIGFQS